MTLPEIEALVSTEALTAAPELPWPKLASGKVREIYEVGDELLLLTTDRLSAFDVILPDGIPGKGILLNQISLWWFERTASVVPNHLPENHDARLADLLVDYPELVSRCMLTKKLQPLTLEAVMRGYLAGSGWKRYAQAGELFGHSLPEGLLESDQLPQPLFTPTTKAAVGDKDEPLTPSEGAELIGEALYQQVESVSQQLFAEGSKAAAAAGLILADTKFEFGLDTDGTLYLIDEVLTPDSSRYWPAKDYQPGRPQQAFDKQFVRDYLETLDWDKTPPGPRLPENIIHETQNCYLHCLRTLIAQ